MGSRDRQDLRMVTISLGRPPRDENLSYAEVSDLITGCIRRTDFFKAAVVAKQFAAQMPDDHPAHLLAAKAHYMILDLNAANEYADRALALGERDIDTLRIKARIYTELGHGKEALRYIEEALAAKTDDSDLHRFHGEVLLMIGDVNAGGTALRKALQLNQRNITAFALLSRLTGESLSKEQIRFVEFLLESDQLTQEEQIKANFALANIYDLLGDGARHFEHLHAMNTEKHKDTKFDRRRSRRTVLAAIDYWSSERLEKLPPIDETFEDLIFIFGFPRSGTTLIEQILSSHPNVVAAGETAALEHAIAEIFRQPGSIDDETGFIKLECRGIADKIRTAYIKRMPQYSAGNLITDKSLENFIHAGLIHTIFPGARLINVRRHPVATCYSCYKQLFFATSVPYSYNMEDLVSKYSDYEMISRHWESVLPGRIHTIEYERLIASPRDVVAKLLEKCGLDWSDQCMNFQSHKRSVATASSIQVRQDLYSHSVDRWRVYEDYLEPLMALVKT
jgi:tetratricopeptide (TPR) repeat protein